MVAGNSTISRLSKGAINGRNKNPSFLPKARRIDRFPPSPVLLFLPRRCLMRAQLPEEVGSKEGEKVLASFFHHAPNHSKKKKKRKVLEQCN